MRSVFFNLLHEAMRKNKMIFLVIADMGMGLVDPIQKDFPDRFINVGIAEQNMIGVAAGLSNAGFRPFCYTISNFLIHRCFEQIRNDVCLHNYPVTLVGTSTGFDNGTLGPTHHVVDDVGCLKILPGIRIYSPSTASSVRLVFKEIMKNRKPAYLRIGKGSFNIDTPSDNINQMVINHEHSDILIITYGNILENCIKAAKIHSRVSIYCMNRIKPIDVNEMAIIFKKYKKIVVVENHFVSTGLYNSICQYLVDGKFYENRLYSIAPQDRYEEKAGDSAFFADKYGYSPEKIAHFIASL